ncbi:hypothetical protein D3H55_05275 [Bacillus salacetis]|uniref:Uncharacterized protein n=1 Tax=Bacillus salacetis TaxID=2315464 RepID=A0A3A1R6G4_9BACI|nr:hypothetical protein D3H55_05275 [Bacillus salacetis]
MQMILRFGFLYDKKRKSGRREFPGQDEGKDLKRYESIQCPGIISRAYEISMRKHLLSVWS